MSDFYETREHKVRTLAYELWEAAGRPVGREDEFWQLAEERLDNGKVRESKDREPKDELDAAGEDSFPASDPVNHT